MRPKLTLSGFAAAPLPLLALSVMFFGNAFPPSRNGILPSPANTSKGAPVVVELFTSEGCSSCPPADALLARLAVQQPIAGAEVIALEEHVDYWNQQGWVDPFSSSEFSERQQNYARSFESASVYTPQMVVDGRVEFTGSYEGKARQSITEAARAQKTPIQLTVTRGGEPDGSLQVRADKLAASTTVGKADVFLAVTEAGLHSAVNAGENAGEDLHHSRVVRRLRKIGEVKPAADASFSSSLPLKLDSGWKLENVQIVVFIQERKSRRILGAASVSPQ